MEKILEHLLQSHAVSCSGCMFQQMSSPVYEKPCWVSGFCLLTPTGFVYALLLIVAHLKLGCDDLL